MKLMKCSVKDKKKEKINPDDKKYQYWSEF